MFKQISAAAKKRFKGNKEVNLSERFKESEFYHSSNRSHIKMYRTCARHQLPALTAALVCSLEASFQRRCSASAAGARSHDSVREQRRERAGLYTPNNRCRPEAPLTSLPKLTPVKNVGEDSGEKGRGKRKNNKR